MTTISRRNVLEDRREFNTIRTTIKYDEYLIIALIGKSENSPINNKAETKPIITMRETSAIGTRKVVGIIILPFKSRIRTIATINNTGINNSNGLKSAKTILRNNTEKNIYSTLIFLRIIPI